MNIFDMLLRGLGHPLDHIITRLEEGGLPIIEKQEAIFKASHIEIGKLYCFQFFMISSRD